MIAVTENQIVFAFLWLLTTGAIVHAALVVAAVLFTIRGIVRSVRRIRRRRARRAARRQERAAEQLVDEAAATLELRLRAKGVLPPRDEGQVRR